MKSSYKLRIKENKKLGLYIEFPSTLLKKLNWNTGDKIEWMDNKDGTFTLLKK